MTKKLIISLFLIPLFLSAQISKKKNKIKIQISHTSNFEVVNGKVIKLGKSKESDYLEMDSGGNVIKWGYFTSDGVLRIRRKSTWSNTGKTLCDSFFDIEGKFTGTMNCTYDSLDRITFYQWSTSSPMTKTYIYDTSGNKVIIPLESTYYGNSKEIHYFDSLKRIIKEERFDKDNKRDNFKLRRFDAAGNEIEYLIFENDSVLSYGQRFRFIKGYALPVEEHECHGKEWKPVFISRIVNGLVVERANYDENGKLKSREFYNYDKNKRMVKARIVAKGKPDYVITKKYDTNGDEIESLCMDGTVIDIKYNMKYGYNERGDLVYKELYINGHPVDLDEYEYVYY